MRNKRIVKADPNLILKLLNEEKDDRYRYMLRQG